MARLIVALDQPDIDSMLTLADTLAGLPLTYKVGYEAYYRFGAPLINRLAERGCDVMLDLKLHDIPRTVEAAVRALLVPGVTILTVHASGGESMLRAAVEAAELAAARAGMPTPAIFAVTILTSIAPLDLPELGFTGGPGENVVRLAALARNAGCAGIVCSPAESADVKHYFGTDFQTLCPGIRPAGSPADDQRRTATPAAAVAAGANYLVVGRPILAAPDPRAAAELILADMQKGATPA